MAVEGKIKVTMYLDKENIEVLRNYLDTRPGAGGVSAIMDKHVSRLADIIRKNKKQLSEIEPGRLTLKKLVQLMKMDVDPKTQDIRNDL